MRRVLVLFLKKQQTKKGCGMRDTKKKKSKPSSSVAEVVARVDSALRSSPPNKRG
jgi:hypothetical protein